MTVIERVRISNAQRWRRTESTCSVAERQVRAAQRTVTVRSADLTRRACRDEFMHDLDAGGLGRVAMIRAALLDFACGLRP